MNSRLPILLMCLICAGICSGQAGENLLVERKPIELPAFDSSRQIARYATPEEYAEAKADSSYVYERLLYRSSGIVVSGFLYAPKQNTGKLPAIVFSRGSLVVRDQAPLLVAMMRRLAREGFIVFAPMFRESDGMEGHDELGGADLDDLKNAIELVKAMPAVDGDNVFLYGESRGGMMTYFALREDFAVRAAAVWGAITDFGEALKMTDPDLKIAKSLWSAFDAEKEAILASRSAIRWPEKIRKPVLIMHGGEDILSPRHSLRMAEALTELKRTYSLVIFANDNHVLTRNRKMRDKLAADWFSQHRTDAR